MTTGSRGLLLPPNFACCLNTIKVNPIRSLGKNRIVCFAELPSHLRRMALFKVNVGLRDKEVCGWRWEWECQVPELKASVFVIPGWIQQVEQTGESHWTKHTKNGEDRLVVLNEIAKDAIAQVRGEHPEFVFVFRGQPLTYGMNNNGWQRARKKVGLEQVPVHDLKYTFSR